MSNEQGYTQVYTSRQDITNSVHEAKEVLSGVKGKVTDFMLVTQTENGISIVGAGNVVEQFLMLEKAEQTLVDSCADYLAEKVFNDDEKES